MQLSNSNNDIILAIPTGEREIIRDGCQGGLHGWLQRRVARLDNFWEGSLSEVLL